MPVAALVSFRLGGTDGVSVESAKWAWALEQIGYEVETVAGDGPVDHLVPGLGMDAGDSLPDPSRGDLLAAFGHADLTIVENLCSLPLNPRALRAVATALRDRPALLHHHDLPWQRPQFLDHSPPPDDPNWCHVTINELSRGELALRGIEAVTVYNTFDLNRPEIPEARRAAIRGAVARGAGSGAAAGAAAGASASASASADDILVLQPTRALPRKNIPAGIALAERLGGTYWLLGPAEDGFGPELERLLRSARCPVLHGPTETLGGMDEAYAACDVVALPSTWEGFGNPSVESVVHHRPLAVGPYPVASELAAFGFEWFDVSQPDKLLDWLRGEDRSLCERNMKVAQRHFNLVDLPSRIARIISQAWGTHR